MLELKNKYKGKYSCKIEVVGNIKRVIQLGLTNNKYPQKPF